MKTYAPASTTYRRTVRAAARNAIQTWLRGLDRASLYSFQVDDVACALEFFTGH